ncbi:hypothetical protein PtA15_7A237 [Puccinia triticina]|uniref:Uncharacterized protein n=1 Tax=Puccinia triticina TaxID=208348 RepID=A0ABY7CMQ5_9BASI|nr:uncharacterized protein PtA15_7A237 [Puccinia triticina]WAQ86511.1 hypothetical protein PtA15_7A237 [Puccinia triticina]
MSSHEYFDPYDKIWKIADLSAFIYRLNPHEVIASNAKIEQYREIAMRLILERNGAQLSDTRVTRQTRKNTADNNLRAGAPQQNPPLAIQKPRPGPKAKPVSRAPPPAVSKASNTCAPPATSTTRPLTLTSNGSAQAFKTSKNTTRPTTPTVTKPVLKRRPPSPAQPVLKKLKATRSNAEPVGPKSVPKSTKKPAMPKTTLKIATQPVPQPSLRSHTPAIAKAVSQPIVTKPRAQVPPETVQRKRVASVHFAETDPEPNESSSNEYCRPIRKLRQTHKTACESNSTTPSANTSTQGLRQTHKKTRKSNATTQPVSPSVHQNHKKACNSNAATRSQQKDRSNVSQDQHTISRVATSHSGLTAGRLHEYMPGYVSCPPIMQSATPHLGQPSIQPQPHLGQPLTHPQPHLTTSGAFEQISHISSGTPQHATTAQNVPLQMSHLSSGTPQHATAAPNVPLTFHIPGIGWLLLLALDPITPKVSNAPMTSKEPTISSAAFPLTTAVSHPTPSEVPTPKWIRLTETPLASTGPAFQPKTPKLWTRLPLTDLIHQEALLEGPAPDSLVDPTTSMEEAPTPSQQTAYYNPDRVDSCLQTLEALLTSLVQSQKDPPQTLPSSNNQSSELRPLQPFQPSMLQPLESS